LAVHGFANSRGDPENKNKKVPEFSRTQEKILDAMFKSGVERKK
jgi:hypothetical protein